MENKKHTFVKMKLQLEMANDDIDAAQYYIYKYYEKSNKRCKHCFKRI